MTADSQWPLQQAVYTALLADAALKTLISNPVRVYDHVPQDSEFPYVVIGESAGQPYDTKTTDGMEQAISIHAWSRYRGLKQVKEIMAAITDALDDVALSVSGHVVPLLQYTFSDAREDPDGLSQHGVLGFRVVTLSTA